MFAIYTMIAGSYTPYALIGLARIQGDGFYLELIWSVAFFGILWKMIYCGENII